MAFVEKSQPPTVAGAAADLARTYETSPHSHFVDLSMNEPELHNLRGNFAVVKAAGSSFLLGTGTADLDWAGPAASPAMSVIAPEAEENSEPRAHRLWEQGGIVDTTRTGSESLPASKEHGRTFRRNEIAKTRSASARICIARECSAPWPWACAYSSGNRHWSC